MMKKYLLTLLLTIGFIFPQDCEEPINVWFKISNDISNPNYGQVVALDMSQGYSYTDGEVVYLILNDITTKEQVILTFPIGHWVVEGKDEIQKEFDSLEEYLKNTDGSLIEKK
tara:strand:+ start:198 stop:536 length:339 start_codon:yes stop_codon:yes gene_type:complete